MTSSAQSLLVTNVPGPQTPRYVLGRRLEHTFPIPTLVDGHALAVALMSYDGGMDFGLLADYDGVETSTCSRPASPSRSPSCSGRPQAGRWPGARRGPRGPARAPARSASRAGSYSPTSAIVVASPVGAHCASARSPAGIPSGVGTSGVSRRYHSASSAA